MADHRDKRKFDLPAMTWPPSLKYAPEINEDQATTGPADTTKGAQADGSDASHLLSTQGTQMINHHQRADLGQLSNELFYQGAVVMGQEQWTEQDDIMNSLMREHLGLKLRPRQNRVGVFLRGSKEVQVETSYTNHAQLRYAMDFAERLSNDQRFTRSRSPTQGPEESPEAKGTIAIISPYQAMLSDVSEAIRERALKKVEAVSIHNAQNSEFDFVINIFPRTSNIGFMGEPCRLNIALTRSIQGELILLDPESFYKGQQRLPDVFLLRQMQRILSRKNRAFFTIKLCPKCGGLHEEDCKCGVCGSTDHKTDVCPTLKCTFCGGKRHLADNCDACRVCHKHHNKAGQECSQEEPTCKYCKGKGHVFAGCPKMQAMVCRECGLSGHISGACPTRVVPAKTVICYTCGQEGHMARECLMKRKWACMLCGKFDHFSPTCPLKDNQNSS